MAAQSLGAKSAGETSARAAWGGQTQTCTTKHNGVGVGVRERGERESRVGSKL